MSEGKKCSTEACGCHTSNIFLAHHSATILVMRVAAIHTPHEKMIRLEMMLDAQAGDDAQAVILRLEMGKMLLLKIVMSIICGC